MWLTELEPEELEEWGARPRVMVAVTMPAMETIIGGACAVVGALVTTGLPPVGPIGKLFDFQWQEREGESDCAGDVSRPFVPEGPPHLSVTVTVFISSTAATMSFASA